MKYTSLSSIQEDLRNGQISCQQLVQHYLHNIHETNDLNIYVEIFAKEALEKAIVLDTKYKDDPKSVGRLFGMIISIKDVICYKGHQVTAASKMLEGFTSLYTATALQRLLDEDVIVIGRVNCDQFAMGSSNENSNYGPTKNAVDPESVPGGSSGASAVAVQANTCLASLGSDTGGSVRQPAAFCGVVGMKPTYGRISRYGLLAYASSFDQIGTLTHNIADAAQILEIMSGADEFDSTASSKEVALYTQNLTFESKAKIAYFEAALQHESLDETIKAKSLALIEQLRAEGHTVEVTDFEYLDYMIPAYYVLTTAEASSNLSRYDGIRFGYRSADTKNLMETYKKSRTEGFGQEVKRRIMLGTFVLSSGYYDAYYTKAQKIRRLIAERTAAIFKVYDFILMPVAPAVAWKIGEKTDNPVEVYLADIYTVQANMAGVPALALPLGVNKNNMPFGIQFMANKFEEKALLNFGSYVQKLIPKNVI